MKRLAAGSALMILIAVLICGCTVNSGTQATPGINLTPTVVNATMTPSPLPTTMAANATVTPSPSPMPVRVNNPGVLSVVTEATYPPFESTNDQGRLQGFDIDLMNEIGKELNLTVVYNQVPYDSIIPLVEANKYDCAIAAITITPQPEAHVNFSDPYYDNKGKAIVTKVGSPIQGPADLAGRKIGISGEGAWYYTELGVSGINPSDINTFYLPRDALLAVSNNVIDAAVGDYALLYPLARQYPDEYAIAPGYLTKVEYFGIAINKDRPGLTIAVDRALDRIKADGRYQNIYDRWLS